MKRQTGECTICGKGIVSKSIGGKRGEGEVAVMDTGNAAYETLAQDLYKAVQKLHGDILQEEPMRFQRTLMKLWRNIE